MVDLVKKDVPPSGKQPDLDALRLIRFVYARRILRGTVAGCALGLVAWVLITTLLVDALPTGSVLRESIRHHDGLGFLLLVIVLIVALLALWVIHFVGPEARFAALVRPVLFGDKDVRITDNPTVADSTHARIRRRGFVRVVAVLGIPLAAAGLAATASLFVPSIRGTFGDGGPVLTVGREASVVDVRTSRSYSGSGRGTTNKTYIVSTPEGRTTVAGGRPEKGDELVLVHDLFGGRSAVLVHGTAALETGVASLIFAVVLAGLIVWQYLAVRTERRARLRAGNPSLAEDLGAMRNGATFELQVGKTARSVGVRTKVARVRDVDRRRRRWLVIGAAGVVVLVGVPVLVVALRSDSEVRPQERAARRVSQSYLAAAGWAPSVYVVYDRQEASRAYAVDQLQAGGIASPRLGASWSLILRSADRPIDFTREDGSRGTSTVTAAVSLYAVAADPRKAAAGIAAHARSLASYNHRRATDITGLPAGWSGVRTDGDAKNGPEVEVGVAVSGYFLTIDSDLLKEYTGVTADQLTTRMVRLASAIAAHGVPALAAATR